MFVEYTLKIKDEALLNVYKFGSGKKKVIIANGLGGNFKAFRNMMEFFKDYQFISWDYRGLYKSKLLMKNAKVGAKSQVSDLDFILKHEKIDNAIFIGWSLGVEILLEYYNKNPNIFYSLILINGPYKNMLNSVLDINRLPYINKILKPYKDNVVLKFLYNETIAISLLDIIKRYNKLYSFSLNTISKIPKLTRYLKILRLVNCNMNEDEFDEVIKDYVSLNMKIMLEILKDFYKKDYESTLTEITCPVLLISSSRDIFVPLWQMKDMHKLIQNSDYMEVFRASHYSLLEYPKMINLKIKRFLEKNKL